MKDEEDKKIDETVVEDTDTETDEDVVEFVFNDDGEEDIKATLKKLRKDLKEAQKEKTEYLTNWQRERADFTNYKKDEQERRESTLAHARENFAEELLPVLDAYDMAFSNREAWEKVDKNWRIGVEYIHAQLLKVLADNGVNPIKVSVGDKVDPKLHEAVENISTDDEAQDHSIAEVTQSGYIIGERVLRAARVKVFEFKK
ncbi:MAG: nucleotide exchange factor GrpE [Candidatus Pacebacteria bacterium]|nr:nucleotide exchange factor GrpE [Candidatus Paceibacterota bacterium]MBP9772458.1 nucleotide exchange factor GrpE [Candidatus Paceibacterota bacterium]